MMKWSSAMVAMVMAMVMVVGSSPPNCYRLRRYHPRYVQGLVCEEVVMHEKVVMHVHTFLACNSVNSCAHHVLHCYYCGDVMSCFAMQSEGC